MGKIAIVEDGIIAGNVDNKYDTRNPISRLLVGNFLSTVLKLADLVGPSTVHEVGCGEGYLSRCLLKAGRSVRGSDFSIQVIAQATRRAQRLALPLKFKVRSVYDLNPEEDSASLIVCCEVLEHLSEPERALGILARIAAPYLLLSVPREPIWRLMNMARLRYLGRFGNTPGHLQNWSKREFLAIVERHVDVLRVESPLPWTVVLCRSNSRDVLTSHTSFA